MDINAEKLMVQSALARLDCGSPFSTAMATQWIVRQLESKDHPPESLHRVYSWLKELSSCEEDSYPVSVFTPPSKWQRGCPEIIPGLRSMPWWKTSSTIIADDITKIVKNLEASGPEILNELLSVKSIAKFQEYRAPKYQTTQEVTGADDSPTAGNENSPLGVRATSKGDWDVLYLDLHGTDNVSSEAAETFPFTWSVLNSIPRKYGHALFSTLQPNTHITVHTGPTNRKLRIQLPLMVPRQEASCRLRVGPEVCALEQFKCLVFDDSFQHEAWNDSEEPRIVLIVDIWHPDLSDQEIKFLDFLRNNQLRRAKQLSKNGMIPQEADFFSVLEKGKQMAKSLEQVLKNRNAPQGDTAGDGKPAEQLTQASGTKDSNPQLEPLAFAPCRAD